MKWVFNPSLAKAVPILRHGMVFCAVSSLLALVFNRVNPIMAQGAAFGAVTMVDRFDDGDVTDLIRTGCVSIRRRGWSTS
jgi:hypothetical protein